MDFFAFVRKLFFFEEKLGEFEQPIQLNNSIARTSLLLLGLPPRQPSPKWNRVERVYPVGKQVNRAVTPTDELREEGTGGVACVAAAEKPSKAKA